MINQIDRNKYKNVTSLLAEAFQDLLRYIEIYLKKMKRIKAVKNIQKIIYAHKSAVEKCKMKNKDDMTAHTRITS